MRKTHLNLVLAITYLAIQSAAAVDAPAEVTGELKQWHKITLTFDGPETSETADHNPFLDYRLMVSFTDGKTSYEIPGYYAADGNAANTSAEAGNKWRVHLCPDTPGTWFYMVSFREGKNIAVNDDPRAGRSAGYMDKTGGILEIAPTDKTGRDFRGKGRLEYVGKHYLRFAGSGTYFLKCGADAPENFLAYQDFDGPFKSDGHKDNFVKDWAPHIKDWRPGDPTWNNGKGKGIIGAVNYLHNEGMNVFSFIPMNIKGDDRNVFPYIDYNTWDRLDVSRLAQWEIVFEHADKLGMYLHFKTQETENELLLDNGDLGTLRKLYYRELIARFSHHLALNWNLGEEINNATHEQKVAWANYFWTHDPYQHHIVIHNMGNPHYDLLGDASALTGFSLQTSKPDFQQVHRRVLDYIRRSAEAGKPWVVACDEPGDASHALLPDAEDPEHNDARKNALWGTFMAGGAGVEWYFGYKHAHSDLTCQDYRSRDKMWDQCKVALDFFDDHQIPFWEMSNHNGLIDTEDGYCLAKPGDIYIVYLKNGGSTQLDLGENAHAYSVKWYNPRTGGPLRNGSVQSISGAGKQSLGTPPTDKNQDWTILIKAK